MDITTTSSQYQTYTIIISSSSTDSHSIRPATDKQQQQEIGYSLRGVNCWWISSKSVDSTYGNISWKHTSPHEYYVRRAFDRHTFDSIPLPSNPNIGHLGQHSQARLFLLDARGTHINPSRHSPSARYWAVGVWINIRQSQQRRR